MLARFKFRLETLLKMRRAARDDRREQLAQAYQAEQVLRKQNEHLSKQLDELRQGSRQASRPGPVHVDTLLGTHRYLLVLHSQQKLLNQRSEQLAAEIERRRELLVDADRQVRVLEKLRDRQQDQHRRKENRREMKRLDEVAQRRMVTTEKAG